MPVDTRFHRLHTQRKRKPRNVRSKLGIASACNLRTASASVYLRICFTMQRRSVCKFDFASYLRLLKAPRALLMFAPGSSSPFTVLRYRDWNFNPSSLQWHWNLQWCSCTWSLHWYGHSSRLRRCGLISSFKKFRDVCMTGGVMHTPSHTNVCKFSSSQLAFSQLILHLKCWNFAGLLILVLVYVFNFSYF